MARSASPHKRARKALHTYYNKALTKALNNPYSNDEVSQLYR
jgi:hypothetical protein